MRIRDISALQQLVTESHEREIEVAFGRPGMDAMRQMQDILKELFNHLEITMIKHQLVFIMPIDVQAPHLGVPYYELNKIAQDLSRHLRSASALLMLSWDGSFSWTGSNTTSPQILSQDSIVYTYNNAREFFFIKGNPKVIRNITELPGSVFAIPTFKELEDALDTFKREYVRTTGCLLFAKVWATPDRLLFCNKPEAAMRNSLYQYIRMTVRGALARMETIVDASHPVDISVMWQQSSHLALIEIKWVGKALAKGKKGAADKGLTGYSDARARAGADQLKQYLDSNAQQTPMHTARGYLVVIDGRRWGVDRDTKHVTIKDGMHYEHQELVYKTPPSTPRIDFAPPIRMFAEPICKLA